FDIARLFSPPAGDPYARIMQVAFSHPTYASLSLMNQLSNPARSNTAGSVHYATVGNYRQDSFRVPRWS
ncbi:MAG: hypothetical protein M3003_08435, partial [Candidatus Dormibacteraeota bacterium]|nr:hypothetical protein [Candidatus Dormibacteraeota bacterium]